MTTETQNLTSELISRPSITPNDAGCIDLIEKRLSPLGFKIVRLPSGPVDNLCAIHGHGDPVFAFAGHTDVVPPGDLSLWQTDPFDPVVNDGMLFGRGAADMKGSVAAMIVAVERYLKVRPDHPGSIAFLLTSDEEGPAIDGTVKIVEYLEQNNIGLEWCLVGEPSSTNQLGDTIRIGRRGSLNAELTVYGEQGHVAYPDRAQNPIHKSLSALVELQKCVWDEGNDHYPPTSFQISNVNAGMGAENVIPGDLKILFNFRYCTENSVKSLQNVVIEILERHDLDYDVDWRSTGQPFLTTHGKLIKTASRLIREKLGVKPELSTGGGTSDGRFIAPMGVELIELGPVNSTIHKINECVSIEELEHLTVIYQKIVQQMLES
jgi:succinyl-diaminopimelate desuccinylase